ncbi:MAG: hypothetical protein DHS20C16_24060 [Phycisphaerae bacterium]|nr:MAG: hypothetical protein DHS20C16_24060 [Phycisphaerae bacterium]
MKVRRLSELKQTQARMLEELRADRTLVDEAVGDSSEFVTSLGLAMGRVESVVASDPELGAHLVVAKQRVVGVPPSFDDDAVASQIYYPAPSRVVGDYLVDESVLCCQMDGSRIALKMV